MYIHTRWRKLCTHTYTHANIHYRIVLTCIIAEASKSSIWVALQSFRACTKLEIEVKVHFGFTFFSHDFVLLVRAFFSSLYLRQFISRKGPFIYQYREKIRYSLVKKKIHFDTLPSASSTWKPTKTRFKSELPLKLEKKGRRQVCIPRWFSNRLSMHLVPRDPIPSV